MSFEGNVVVAIHRKSGDSLDVFIEYQLPTEQQIRERGEQCRPQLEYYHFLFMYVSTVSLTSSVFLLSSAYDLTKCVCI